MNKDTLPTTPSSPVLLLIINVRDKIKEKANLLKNKDAKLQV